ncbi:conserved uncharacterized protein [Methylocaldum marinum]|uniref:Conserved uncharacterized protein n=1 Tax=Methylocaldum marinum TaxID=1432792 RepID=A0A250KV99_9GAMM|nr:conserved uncharacterized protein [Methylocaldum marinum]
MPHSVQGEEISHAVLTGGRPVHAAGEADIVFGGGLSYGVEITPRSGHFHNGADPRTNAKIIEIGREAFHRYGITFP